MTLIPSFSDRPPSSQLCSHCERILGVKENRAAAEDLSKDWGHCGFARRSTVSQLREAAKTCELCNVVWTPLFKDGTLDRNSYHFDDIQDPIVEIRIRTYDGLKPPAWSKARPRKPSSHDAPYTLLYTYTFLRGATDLPRHIRKVAPITARIALTDGLFKVVGTALKYASLGVGGTLEELWPTDRDYDSDSTEPGNTWDGMIIPGVTDKRDDDSESDSTDPGNGDSTEDPGVVGKAYWNHIGHGDRVFQVAQPPCKCMISSTGSSQWLILPVEVGFNGNIAEMGSSAAFERAKQWLQACRCFDPVPQIETQSQQIIPGRIDPNGDKMLQHGMKLVNLGNAQSLFGAAPRTELPTRVLYVSCSDRPPSVVRLHISEAGDNRPYATLSYCWGGMSFMPSPAWSVSSSNQVAFPLTCSGH
jgi:hypothetical protein